MRAEENVGVPPCAAHGYNCPTTPTEQGEIVELHTHDNQPPRVFYCSFSCHIGACAEKKVTLQVGPY